MPTNDRNYYRMLDTEDLLDIAKQVQTTELEIVLAERLRKKQRQLESQHYDQLSTREY